MGRVSIHQIQTPAYARQQHLPDEYASCFSRVSNPDIMYQSGVESGVLDHANRSPEQAKPPTLLYRIRSGKPYRSLSHRSIHGTPLLVGRPPPVPQRRRLSLSPPLHCKRAYHEAVWNNVVGGPPYPDSLDSSLIDMLNRDWMRERDSRPKPRFTSAFSSWDYPRYSKWSQIGNRPRYSIMIPGSKGQWPAIEVAALPRNPF